MDKRIIAVVVGVAVIAGVFLLKSSFSNRNSSVVPTPTPEAVVQLTADQAPRVSLAFSADAHYVTVKITDIQADQLEYNLIYEATVKSNKIQTGVNASAKLEGKSEYTQKQLLGSESSGHFTYHANIQNAVMELTLRDSLNRSVFTAPYPFTVKAGTSIDLAASQ